jgi:hydrogenase nickel incorporation protein HypA/HybF
VHEMGIMQGILAASFDAAEEAGATHINEIRITIGDLTEIQTFALDFAFEALTPGTMAEGAKLLVTELPPRSRCRDCGLEYDHDRFEMLCPTCMSFNVELLQGREMRIDSIEADDVEGDASGSGGPETARADTAEDPSDTAEE